MRTYERGDLTTVITAASSALELRAAAGGKLGLNG